MTQNTLTDLRSLEQAAQDGHDKYFLGLCTLFVATIEDAKDRISQLQLIFCSQLFPALQARLSECDKAVERVEKLHEGAIDKREVEKLQESHRKELQGIRQENERLFMEKSRIQGSLEEMSIIAGELRQSHDKARLENAEMQQRLQQLAREISLLKARDDPSSTEKAGIFARMSCSDDSPKLDPRKDVDRDLRNQLEQKSEEVKLECIRRQLLSSEMDKEKRATQFKLQSLKKRYRDLKKQYNVLFQRSSRAVLQDQQAGTCEQQEEASEHLAVSAKSHPNTSLSSAKGGRKGICSCCRKAADCGTMNSTVNLPIKEGDFSRNGASPDHNCLLAESSPISAKHAEIQVRQAVLVNGDEDPAKVSFREVKLEPNCGPSPELSCTPFQSQSSADKQRFSEDDGGADVDRIPDSLQALNNSQTSPFQEAREDKLLLGEPLEPDRHNPVQTDKVVEAGFHESLLLKVAERGRGVASGNGKELCNQDKNMQVCSKNGYRPGEILNSSTELQEGKNEMLVAENRFLSVQKRAFPTNSVLPAVKSLRTTWKNTRSRADATGFDPHDDFLDTPRENVVKSLADGVELPLEAEAGREVSFSQITTQGDAVNDCEGSARQHKSGVVNEEKSELTSPERYGGEYNKSDLANKTENAPRLPQPPSSKCDKPTVVTIAKKKPSTSSKQGSMYKYVESVRKKDEREKLQGIECNQCKKFYDALLTEDTEGAASARCEHHNAVSRHRYQYIPPATPDGFWNIGFDSDL